MKGGIVFVAVLFCVVGSDAFFDDAFRQLLLRPGGLDITNIVRCSADEGRRFNVPLVPEVVAPRVVRWRPETPDYITLPDSLECANTNIDLVRSILPDLQGIERDLQGLSRLPPFDLTSTIPLNMRGRINAVCSAVYNDTADMDNNFVFVDNEIGRVTAASNVSGFAFSSDVQNDRNNDRNSLNDFFEAMRCYVNYTYVDLGPAFLPRIMIAGGCVSRSCSVPINLGQTCRPDLSAIARLPGFRYDCCWDYDAQDQEHKFDCGWRRVMLPILCDCDCVCPPRE